VVQRHHLADLAQAARIAVAGDRIVVPEDAVAAARDQVGNRLVDVVLEQLHVAAPEVHPALLVEAGAVQALVAGGLEALADAVVVASIEPDRREATPARGLREQWPALAIEERDPAVLERDL